MTTHQENTGRHIIFYDGACGLCHSCVRFVLRHDKAENFMFAPLQGEYAQSKLDLTALTSKYGDTIIVETHTKELKVKSDAVIHILKTLGGAWGALGSLYRIFPKGVRNWGYDLVGKYRHTFFKKPAAVCPIVPNELQKRFLD
jgi:predicted DCC family thiol-disulfide oxidoreductase YuxK